MRLPLWRRRQDAELSEEIRSHLQMAIQDRLDRGATPEDAERAARAELGNELLVRETARDAWGWVPLEQIAQDLAYACRSLVKVPAFTVAAVLTLGLGIGANTAMFSVVRAVVLRPLPFPQPDRLVALNELDLREGGTRESVSWPNFFDWQRDTRTLVAMAGYRRTSVTVTGAGESRHVDAVVASSGLFTTLGVAPAMGRGFTAAEEQPGANAIVISDELRRRTFGDTADAVGRPLTVDGRSVTVIGVMPAGFVFPIVSPPPELWLTVAEDRHVDAPDDTPIAAQRGAHFIQVVGRMKAGISVAKAQAELDGLMAVLRRDFPDENSDRGARVTPLLEAIVGDHERPLWLLLAAVSCVLLIACVNLASLVTARGITRGPELALRVALGGSRTRVIRLLLAEAAVIAGVAAIAGVLLARVSIGGLIAIAPDGVKRLADVAIDGTVLAYTAALAMLSAILVGVWPAFRVTRGDLRTAIGTARTSSGGQAHGRWLRGLIVIETALGAMLLVAAALVVSGLDRLVHTSPGFDVDRVATMQVNLPDARYPYLGQIAFYDRLLPELAAIPGVEGVAIVGPLPLSGNRFGISFEQPGGPTGGAAPSAGFAYVSPGYFQTLRIPLSRGREFTDADTDAAPRVVVVNESFVRRYLPHQDPIGARLKPGLSTTEKETPWREIVGVVADVKQQTLNEEPTPMYFVPYRQGLVTTPHLVIRGAGVDAIPPAVRRVVAGIDPELAVYDVRTLEERVALTTASQRFTTTLLTLFAGIGLLLTAIGLYGVLAYVVAQRMAELGVRVALGATPADILASVLSGALALVIAGLAIGAVAATALGRVVRAALDFVGQPDAVTYGAVAALLLLVAVLAAVVPARRALRVDPMQTLRAQ